MRAELALSQKLAAESGAANIDFSIEDVHALSFADDSFDTVHTHQVLQHVADPVQALREMRRVTKPGGIVAARDADYAGFIWFPLLPELDEWLRLNRVAARANGGEPDAGRRLLSWARAAGFEDVTATASTWCYSTPDERAWWGGMWTDRILESALAREVMPVAPVGGCCGRRRLSADFSCRCNTLRHASHTPVYVPRQIHRTADAAARGLA